MRRLELSLLVLLLAACGKPAVHGVNASLEAEPPKLDFGPVLLGYPATRTFQLVNTSQLTAPFNLQTPAGYTVAPASGSLQAGGRTTLTVTFNPAAAEEEDGKITGSIEVPLTGRGVAAAIHADMLDFGVIPIGTSSTLPLAIHNDAELPLSLTFDLTQATAGTYALGTAPDHVDAHGTASIEVTFSPMSNQREYASVSITPCGSCDAVPVQLSGKGGRQGLTVSPKSIDFGTVTAGRSVSRPLTLTNLDFPLEVDSTGLVSGRQFSVDGFSGSLMPGESKVLNVVFSPLAEGDDTGAVAILGQGAVQLGLVNLHGIGGGPNLVADPTSLDLGVRAVGIPEERTILIKNAGMGSVHVTSLQVTGDGAAAWKVVPANTFPADVTTTPLSLDVTFQPLAAGASFDAQIVVGSDQEDQPQLVVPLAASALQLPPCQATVSPPLLRFGIVPQGKTKTRKARIDNTGTSDCLVMDVYVDPATSHFQADTSLAGQILHPGQGQDIPVTFTASAVTALTDLADLHVRISDPIMSDRVVNLSALATELDVEAPAIDFGKLPIGYRGVKPLTVTNVGKVAAQINSVTIDPGTSNEFTVLVDYNDIKLKSGDIYTAQLGYAPTAAGPDIGEAAVNFALYAEPLFVDLAGEGSTEPCGDLCLTPVASCPEEQTVTVDDTVTLAGGATEPGHTVTCTWKVIAAPSESTAKPQLPRQCSTVFQPDAPGDYDLQLTVQDDRGQTSTCDTKVHAVIGPGLWVELYWLLPGDVDLHLFHPDGGDNHDPDVWNNAPYDCFFGNMNPDWDVTGSPDDDPYLDHDDTFGTGPENIHLDYPTAGIRYTVGIRWFAQAQALTQTTAITRIYCGGQLVDESNTTLNELHEMVVFGTVEFAADGNCELVKDGTVLHY